MSSSKGQVITGVNDIPRERNQFVFHSGTSISSEGELLTNGNLYINTYTSKLGSICLIACLLGGRVLITVSLAPSLALAAAKATHAAQNISFEGKQFRTDIAHKGIARYPIMKIIQKKKKSFNQEILSGLYCIMDN